MATRRTGDPRKDAELAFKAAKAPPPLPPDRPAGLPGTREQVTLRIDRDVLDYFQKDGPGWQDRIVEALRRAAGTASVATDTREASNDE